MNHADFTDLARYYVHRPGYSLTVLKVLAAFVRTNGAQLRVADIGAGTGKLTNDLLDLGVAVYAVEPNDAMLKEGKSLCNDNSRVTWVKGNAEKTPLPDSSVDWVLMGSSFHWTNPQLALREFDRILTPGSFFTALWNPRDLSSDPLQRRIEDRIYEMVPELKRISSGSKEHMQGIEEVLLSTNHFHNLFFTEARHSLIMNKDRYLGVWRSVNDIRVQAGEKRFREILQMIEDEISNVTSIQMNYKTRAWTVQKKDKII
jgi:ubiquinone/menaquinone biosynthesis C-methylase UbiE